MDKLYGMRLSVMAQAYRDLEEMPGTADMSFDERFAMIVDAEWDARRVNKRTRLLRQAGFPEPEANVADVRYDADRKLDKAKSKGAISTKTDSGGTAKFSSLPAGMYLVVEEGKSGASAKYETFAPYLISVPLAENGKWNYNVVSAPKTTPSELVETPAPSNPGGGGDNNTALTHSETTSTNRIKTGDTNNPAALLLTTLSGALAAVVAFFMMKREKKI